MSPKDCGVYLPHNMYAENTARMILIMCMNKGLFLAFDRDYLITSLRRMFEESRLAKKPEVARKNGIKTLIRGAVKLVGIYLKGEQEFPEEFYPYALDDLVREGYITMIDSILVPTEKMFKAG
jgi:hypothetical protein